MNKKCPITGCDKDIKNAGLCGIHYERKRAGRDMINRKEQFIIDNPPKDGIGLIPLTKGQVATVSEEDYERVIKYQWTATYDKTTKSYYAKSAINGVNTNMNRFIMQTPKGMSSDHINHDTLDNRRENLRDATASQSGMNQRPRGGTSKHKGVYKKKDRWICKISVNKKRYEIGSFKEEEDAAIVYNVAAQLMHGEFAYLNDV